MNGIEDFPRFGGGQTPRADPSRSPRGPYRRFYEACEGEGPAARRGGREEGGQSPSVNSSSNDLSITP